MALSPHTTRRFVRLVASALAAAAIAAPTALPAGSPDAFERAVNRHLATDTASPSGLISENSASQNRVASPLPHGLRSDNSASQNRLDRISTPQDRLISENSASQNRLVQTAPSTTAVANAPTNGFDWRDAAVGAGSTLALTLLAIGAAVAVRRTRAGVAAWH